MYSCVIKTPGSSLVFLFVGGTVADNAVNADNKRLLTMRYVKEVQKELIFWRVLRLATRRVMSAPITTLLHQRL